MRGREDGGAEFDSKTGKQLIFVCQHRSAFFELEKTKGSESASPNYGWPQLLTASTISRLWYILTFNFHKLIENKVGGKKASIYKTYIYIAYKTLDLFLL